MTPAMFVVIRVNPGPAVKAQQLLPCIAAPIIMSLGLLVDTKTDVFALVPDPVPGRDVFGSKGLL